MGLEQTFTSITVALCDCTEVWGGLGGSGCKQRARNSAAAISLVPIAERTNDYAQCHPLCHRSVEFFRQACMFRLRVVLGLAECTIGC